MVPWCRQGCGCCRCWVRVLRGCWIWQDRADPRMSHEVRAQRSELSRSASLADLSSFGLLPKMVFLPRWVCGRAGRAAWGPGTTACSGTAALLIAAFLIWTPGGRQNWGFGVWGCSRRYLTAQNLQEFLIFSLSAQPLVQIVLARAGHTKQGRL